MQLQMLSGGKISYGVRLDSSAGAELSRSIMALDRRRHPVFVFCHCG
jgi:hypothetical protein